MSSSPEQQQKQNTYVELKKVGTFQQTISPTTSSNGGRQNTNNFNRNFVLQDNELAKALMEEEFLAVEMELAQKNNIDGKLLDVDDEFGEIKEEESSVIDDDESEYFLDEDEEGDEEIINKEDEDETKFKKFNKTLTLKDLSCPECGEILKTKSGLTRHVKTRHKNLPIAKNSRRPSSNPNSSSSKTNQKKLTIPYTCPLCKVKFASRTELKKHLESVHEGAAVLKCDICERYVLYTTTKNFCNNN